MIGYHYTDARLVDVILKEGLRPQPLRREFKRYIKSGNGIWVWVQELGEADHWATVLFQCMDKKTKRIALFEVSYDESHRLKVPNKNLGFAIDHFYSFDGDMTLSHSSKADLLGSTIAPKQLRLIHIVNLEELIRFKSDKYPS